MQTLPLSVIKVAVGLVSRVKFMYAVQEGLTINIIHN